jgi:2-enoate reductase
LKTHPVSASAVPNYHNPEVMCRPLKIEEIEKIVKAFGDAAAILVSAGIDGIELHGHEGYLLDQFTTAIWNQRTDKYGGDLSKRLTLPIEVLREIKSRVGEDFPVQYRFGLKHNIKGLHSGALPGEPNTEAGRDVKQGIEMAKLLEEAGYDSLHVDAGCYDSWYWAHPPVYQEHGCMVDMASEVKKAVKIPVIAVGRLEVPELAEKVVAEGQADIVCLGRGLLADPYWPKKTSAGKVEEIRPCIGCHDGCIGRFFRGRPLSCAVNPACGREGSYRLTRTDKARTVMVVGGGVAGMEAARAAASRGHRVMLYEKQNKLGGHLIEASVPDFKRDLANLLYWYQDQLLKLGVEVKLETEVTEALAAQNNPDILVAATGSLPVIPSIPGIEHLNVISCIDCLLGKKPAGRNVAVIGGGLVGCETALWLAKNGHQVTILEMLPELMIGSRPVPQMNRMMLIDLLAFKGVKICSQTRVQGINDQGVLAVTGSAQTLIKADTIVLAAGLKPDDRLCQVFSSEITDFYVIGDCHRPRNIMGAIWDGYEVGRAI